MIVPLTEIQILSVVAQVRSGKLWAGNSVVFAKPCLGSELPDVTIVLRVDANGKLQCAVACYRRPWNSGRFLFFDHLPFLRINRVNSPQIARSHPEQPALLVPRQRLRCN